MIRFRMKTWFLLAALNLLLQSVVVAAAPLQSQTPRQFLEQKGYQVLSDAGLIYSFQLTRKYLRATEGIHEWGVQRFDPKKYIGQTIGVHRFIVSNHPLQKVYPGSKIVVNVFVVNSLPIGGTSLPDIEGLHGGFYSVDGKTLEEVHGISKYQAWRKQWVQQFK